MKTLIAGFSALTLGIAMAYGADPVVPPVDSQESTYQQPADGQVKTETTYDRQTQPDGSVREQKKVDTKSKSKKVEEKATY